MSEQPNPKDSQVSDAELLSRVTRIRDSMTGHSNREIRHDRAALDHLLALAERAALLETSRERIRKDRERQTDNMRDANARIAELTAALNTAEGEAFLDTTIPGMRRVREMQKRAAVWREVAETGDAGNEPLPSALNHLDEALAALTIILKRRGSVEAQAALVPELVEALENIRDLKPAPLDWRARQIAISAIAKATAQ